MIKRELFDKYGFFNEELHCCEDYDFWLRLSLHEKFLLVGDRLTVKEGGRSDQVSVVHREGMDRFRISSLVSLLNQQVLTRKQKADICEILIKKCCIYGNGCLKHGKKDEGKYYLDLAKSLCT